MNIEHDDFSLSSTSVPPERDISVLTKDDLSDYLGPGSTSENGNRQIHHPCWAQRGLE